MGREISANQLLGSSKKKKKEEEVVEENTNEVNEEVEDNTVQKGQEEGKPKTREEIVEGGLQEENDEDLSELRKIEDDKAIKKESISDKEMSKIEEKMNEKAGLMANAVNAHDNIVKAKEKEEKEIEEYKKKKDQKKDATSPLTVSDTTVKSSKKERAKGLSKLQKIKNLTKTGKSAELPLFASNYMIKMYGMNTWINIDNYFDTFFKEFGYFQNINKLKLIYENSEFLFKDGDKVDFETFLNITSPDDVTLIYALWSVVNNDGDPVNLPATCEHCGETHEREVTPRKLLQSSFTDDHRNRFKDYDSTKTINELQADVTMGEKKSIIHEEDGVRYRIVVTAPNLKRYFYVDNNMRKFIVEELSEYIPGKLLNSIDDTDKLRYLYQQKRADVNSLYNRYTENLLYIESIKLSAIDSDEEFTLTLEDDGAHDVIEIVKTIPDEMMKKIIDSIEELASQEDPVNLQGEPFRCSNCKKITSMDDVPVGDLLFFTIQKMQAKRSLQKR